MAGMRLVTGGNQQASPVKARDYGQSPSTDVCEKSGAEAGSAGTSREEHNMIQPNLLVIIADDLG